MTQSLSLVGNIAVAAGNAGVDRVAALGAGGSDLLGQLMLMAQQLDGLGLGLAAAGAGALLLAVLGAGGSLGLGPLA